MLCLQEINIKENKKPLLKNYEVIYFNRHNSGKASGGVAIFIKDSYYFEKLNIQTNLEATAISTNIPNKVSICNIYIPPNYDIQESEIIQLIKELPKPIVLLGDFNAHNPIWGSQSRNKKGKLLENIILTSDLIVHNTIDPTYFNESHKTFSNIDLTLSDAGISTDIEWEVLDSLYDSDHFPIKGRMNMKKKLLRAGR